eukprot:TRINITY_DN3450_c0_g2_i1.p1 TRINITY_DN3450_c0_g2~~TRINITY_DN3450_c0_g2_i1.p1  ORF type:complete len:1133 (+),score=306.85 TRINITY_DN3450_c0_g2_i1:263-3400(+)
MANVTEAFNFMEKVLKIRVVGCNATDIVEGSKKQMMGVIFLLINKAKTSDIVAEAANNAPPPQSPRGLSVADLKSSPTKTQESPRGASPRGATPVSPRPNVSPRAAEPAAEPKPATTEAPATTESTDQTSTSPDQNGAAAKKVPPARPHRAGVSSGSGKTINGEVDKPAVPPKEPREKPPVPEKPERPEKPEKPSDKVDKQDKTARTSSPGKTRDSPKGTRSSTGKRSSKQFTTVDIEAGAGLTGESSEDAEVASIRQQLVKSKTYEQHLLKLQSAFRAALARAKKADLEKKRKAVVERLEANKTAMKGVVHLQAIARGRIVRNQMKKRRRRNEIAKEMVTTEETYVRNLQVLVDVYLKALKALGDDIIPAATIRIIFSEIEVIKSYNTIIVQKLRARYQKWYSEGQKVGDIFLQLTPFLKVYTAYVNNYNLALKTVTELAQNQKIAKVLMDCRMDSATSGLELTSFLIMPIQRIPRYVMLLTDLFKHTPEDHPDFADLKKALASMESVADYVNQKKREAENLMGVLIVSKHISEMANPNELAQPHRRYVRQGALTEIEGAKRENKKRYMFLFNDILLCCKEPSSYNSFLQKLAKERGTAPPGLDLDTLRDSDLQFKYQFIAPLVGAKIVDVMDPKNPNAFEIHLAPPNSLTASSSGVGTPGGLPQQALDSLHIEGADPSQPRRIQFVAPSAQVKDEWLLDFDEQIMSCLEKRRSRLEISPEEERSYEKPTAVRVSMRGLLLKRGQSGDWRERYVTVQEDFLRYWKSRAAFDAGEAPSNVVPLLFSSVQLVAVMDRPHCFQLLTKERIYNFSIPSPINPVFERLVWVTTIRDAIFTHVTDIEIKKSKEPKEAPVVAAGAANARASATLKEVAVAAGNVLDATVTIAVGPSASSQQTTSTKTGSLKAKRTDSTASTESNEDKKDKRSKSASSKPRSSVSKISKSGELYRISSSSEEGYKKYKTVLKNGELALFKPKKSKAYTTIDLVLCPSIEDTTLSSKTVGEEKYFYFSLQTADRVYKLGGKDEADVADWLSKLNDTIRSLTGK